MTALGDLDRARIGELHTREVVRFQEARPRSLAMIARARAHMPNGMPMAWMAVAATRDDVARYLSAYGELLAELR
jgi:hypothetical protein